MVDSLLGWPAYLAGLVITFGIIWRGFLKPAMKLLRELVDLIRDVRDLLKTDDKGRGLPQRVTDLEAMFERFVASLAPMVTAIGLLSGPQRRTTTRTRKGDK